MNEPIEKIFKTKVYGVIREEKCSNAVEIAEGMIAGGIRVIEINMNTEERLEKTISKLSSIPDITLVAGGIITAEQALNAINAGANVIASPIIQNNLVKLSKWHKIPLILTVSTPNEAYTAWKFGVPLIKVFPIEDLGGVKYIEDMLRPMPFLNLMPIGSVDIEQAHEYIKAGAKSVAVGRQIYAGSSKDEIIEKSKIFVKNLEPFL